MDTPKLKQSVLYTWFWIITLFTMILCAGYFTFVMVSDKGQPSWDYRPVKSIPSESPYAEYQKNPAGQHVSGREGK